MERSVYDPNVGMAWWISRKTPYMYAKPVEVCGSWTINPWWLVKQRMTDKVKCDLPSSSQTLICSWTSQDTSSEYDWGNVVPGRILIHQVRQFLPCLSGFIFRETSMGSKKTFSWTSVPTSPHPLSQQQLEPARNPHLVHFPNMVLYNLRILLEVDERNHHCV